MKYLLTALAFCFCLSGMAAAEIAAEKSTDIQVESAILFDRGKKKKLRVKRIKAKRKRRCNRAARRNFAG